MSHIRSDDTKPELFVRKLLFAAGFRYRLHVKSLPGKPDIVLAKWRTAIFVNGCFWHVHEGCPKATHPSSNTNYWNEKLRRNQERDRQSIQALLNAGWRTLVVWECACRPKLAGELLALMAGFIRSPGKEPRLDIGRTEVEAAALAQGASVQPKKPARDAKQRTA